ncbi:MAG TPA: hypothetical protein VFN19_01460 [Candidatus Nanopelagicales bacterium]|nr:hypothetical protein [Candidatus Nanopelagicales bacterium]
MSDPDKLVVRGWEVLRLTSDVLQIDLVPALGGTVISLRRRADDLELLWQTPWGLRHRGSLNLTGSAEAAMYGSYPGGWHPVFPNGGDSATSNGVEWGYDGEARLTWLDWTMDGNAVVLSGRLARSPFTLTRSVGLADDEVTITDTVVNVGAEHLDVMWGQQIAFGEALIGPDTVVVSGSTTVRPDTRVATSASYDDLLPWPRAYGQHAMVNLRGVGTEAETRLAYLADFTPATIDVRRPSQHLAVRLRWEELAWPYVWYALETGARKGFPWYGAGRFLAFTPATSWPAHGLHDARRVSSSLLRIQPDGSRTAHLSVRVTGG